MFKSLLYLKLIWGFGIHLSFFLSFPPLYGCPKALGYLLDNFSLHYLEYYFSQVLHKVCICFLTLYSIPLLNLSNHIYYQTFNYCICYFNIIQGWCPHPITVFQVFLLACWLFHMYFRIIFFCFLRLIML